jgi:hypothetical protein
MNLQSVALSALLLVSVACSSNDAPLTVAPQGAGGASGSPSGTAGTSGTGGASTGGMASGGAAMGGIAGKAGSGAGSGGSSAGSGGSGGQLDLPDALASTPNEFGAPLKDSWFITPCYQELTFNCLTVSSANANGFPNCPAAQDKFEESGAVFLETFKLGGDSATLYDITFRAAGIVEPKHYVGGDRHDGNNWLAGATPANSDLLYTGGEPQAPDSFNVFKLSVFNTGYAGALPAGNDNPDQHFYLNSFPEQAAKFYATVAMDYQFVVSKVPGGATIEYLVQDTNCLAIQNCGSTEYDEQCSAPRTVNGLTLPATYQGKPLAMLDRVSDGKQPYAAQFIHITVEDIEVSPQ